VGYLQSLKGLGCMVFKCHRLREKNGKGDGWHGLDGSSRIYFLSVQSVFNHSHQIRILLYGHYRIAYLIKPDSNIDILLLLIPHNHKFVLNCQKIYKIMARSDFRYRLMLNTGSYVYQSFVDTKFKELIFKIFLSYLVCANNVCW